MNSQTCVLEDGRRVHFSLKKRQRDRFYLVSFRGPDRKRKERSTKEINKRRATDSAIVIITTEWCPRSIAENPSWDDAIDLLVRQTKADNLRPTTIEQYRFAVGHLREAYPKAHGPGEITPAMASRFKAKRRNNGIKPRTVQGNLDNLSIVYNKWWMNECRVLDENPFADVSPLKLDKPDPRIISRIEEQAFLDWLDKRWGGWRFPLLFLEVKGLVGCRILALASVKKDDLKDGRLHLGAETTKGRKLRKVKLPPEVFGELCKSAGPIHVFEKFSEQLRSIHQKRGHRHYASCVQDYAPARLKGWMQDQLGEYFVQNPEAERFKLHNFRGTAMSRAKAAGISYEDAAIAFGCDPKTMRQHYVALDETAITDRVMETIQGCRGEKGGETADSGHHEDAEGGENNGVNDVGGQSSS